ncbi:hypothetical protein BUALT_Bualt06G0075900 [Buddleja alternifolia]|uniref:WRKY domain-containing protein n=1 Tax=Buddleja alternifolia TaxID=168488 RepID=A0AAV6XDN7_9LAMI|nr:hypothetical protein BUALT_Bualt06G0075900 [Buddleja alternifolia]
MEESLPLIAYGCKLAKEIEQNLPNLATQPDILLSNCEEILRVFGNIRERLVSQAQMSIVPKQQQAGDEFQQLGDHIGVGIQEWLRRGTSGATHESMSLLNAVVESGRMKGTMEESGLEFKVRDLMGGRDVARSLAGGTRGEIVGPIINAPDSNRTSSSQRQRKRKDEGEKIVKRVAAPRMGNLDLPPEDGYTWRKYGQKEILGSVTYRGTHTCHMSSTAPSAAAAPPEQGSVPPTTTAAAMQPFSSSLPTTHWLAMQIFHNLDGSAVAGSSGGGPSAARYPEYQLPVADMADAMFNSGSTSSNSMDLIFSSMDDKWDSEEKKD